MTPARSTDDYENVFLMVAVELKTTWDQLSEHREDALEEAYAAVAAAYAEQSERRLAYLARLRSRLAGAPNLRATVRERLIVLIDRIRGALGLMLVRLRSALSQRSGALRSTLVQLTVGLRYIHRNEPDDDCWLSPRPKQPYGRVRGVAHAVS